MRSLTLLTVLFVSLLTAVPTYAEITLAAPDEVAAGAELEVGWSGEHDARDFVTIVQPDLEDGKYGDYKYARQNPVKLLAPEEPGTWELRFLAKDPPYATLAQRTITVTPVSATLEVPANVEAGGTIEVSWTGPANPRDFITVVEAGAKEGAYGNYKYARAGKPVQIVVPEKAGDYEVRYLTGKKYYTLASRPFSITDISASVEGPASVVEGQRFEVRFVGTGNPRDFVTIVPADAAEGKYGSYSYTRDDESVELMAPEAAGKYEIRYLTARKYRTLARQPIEVTAVGAATLEAPAEVRGGDFFEVAWQAVGNDHDYITIVEPSAEPREYGHYAYVRRGNPVRILAPLTPGDYELRYALGSSRRILATRPIRVLEPETKPGKLVVIRSGDRETGDRETLALPQGAAIELILDASGSMLQRQGGTRRIEIAKTVLSDLVRDSLPAGTPFALRVFGHREADSCRTDLEIALSPLASSSALASIGGIEAKNLAKTPIARSLELVAQDLAGVEGPTVVVLVTDGEETCGGDPAAAVAKLREQGFDVRVNIVGFAIDDDGLEAQFRSWADAGGGSYHDAGSAEDLGSSIRESLRASYDVLDAAGEVVGSSTVGGGELILPAGDYRLRVEGQDGEMPVSVIADDRVVVDLAAEE